MTCCLELLWRWSRPSSGPLTKGYFVWSLLGGYVDEENTESYIWLSNVFIDYYFYILCTVLKIDSLDILSQAKQINNCGCIHKNQFDYFEDIFKNWQNQLLNRYAYVKPCHVNDTFTVHDFEDIFKTTDNNLFWTIATLFILNWKKVEWYTIIE